jgi:hypothetical protein
VEALPRDAHPTLTEKDNDGNVSNPANAFAPKGHVWGIGLPNDLNGNVRSVEATPANLDLVEGVLGKTHSTTNKLRAMVKAQDPNNPQPITSGTWFNEDGTRLGKKSYTKVAEESLTDPEAIAKAETSRMRSITTKTVSTSGYSTTKPIEGVDYVPAPKPDENVDVSDSGAEPGRMFTTDGKRTIEISRENLDNLTRLKGEDHPDVVKMDKLYRQAKGLPTKEQDQASAEKRSVNFEKSLGRSGKTFVDSPVGPIVDVSPGALEGKEIQGTASRKAEFERTVPGAQDSLIEEAAGHITAGRRIPRDLRRTIGAEGVSKAMTKANVVREPLGRN